MKERQNFVAGLVLGVLISSVFYSLFGFKYSSSPVEQEKLDRIRLKEITPEPSDLTTALLATHANSTPLQTTTITAIQPVEEEHNFTLLLESLQKERQSTLKKACLRISNQTCPSKQNHIKKENLYSKTYKLSVCEIYKCGYSSWLAAIFVMEDVYTVDEYLAGKIIGDKVIKLGQKIIQISSTTNATEMERNWDESLKVILVRNPFDRIVSAYNDKMVPSGGYSYHYGPLSERINAEYRHLRFNEEDRNKTDDGSATFEDFVNFLILGTSTDGHWQFYHQLCDPCLYKYDYIAKFETLSDDVNYLKKFLKISKEHQRAMFPKSAYRTTSREMKKHFDQIPKSLARKLYEMYKKDFDLFGYEQPEWLC